MTARDYFQDIVPPDGNAQPERPSPLHITVPERSIRNLSVPSRPMERGFGGGAQGQHPLPQRQERGSGVWLWVIAVLGVVLLGGLLLFAFRPTTITVIPRTHTVVFDSSSVFTAYATANQATGTLSYSVSTLDLDDSEVVSAVSSKTTKIEKKATGSLTVTNEYSKEGVRLIKNTRFQSPDGLIFHAMSDVVVPGMSSVPGKVTVTVIADQPGIKYNIGPTTRFKVPGLSSNAEMFAKIYAKSDSAFSGGSSGSEPGVDAGEMDAAMQKINARVTQAIHNKISELASSSVVFVELVNSQYTDAAATPEDGSHIRIHKHIHVIIPTFDTAGFARAVAQTVSSDADTRDIHLVPLDGYGARILGTNSTTGTEPISFTLTGTAKLLWSVDSDALAKALAGKNQSAFQSIVDGFTSIQEARARIEPFWASSFPSNPASIHVSVHEAATSTRS